MSVEKLDLVIQWMISFITQTEFDELSIIFLFDILLSATGVMTRSVLHFFFVFIVSQITTYFGETKIWKSHDLQDTHVLDMFVYFHSIKKEKLKYWNKRKLKLIWWCVTIYSFIMRPNIPSLFPDLCHLMMCGILLWSCHTI